MKMKRKGRGRGQDRVRNEHTSQNLFAYRGRRWRKASRAGVLSYSTSDLVEMKQDYAEHAEARYKK